MQHHRRQSYALVTIVAAVVVSFVAASCSVTVTSFDDQFGASKVNTQWIVLDRPGDASNREAQCYRPGNVAESGGHLVITTKVDQSCPGYRYTSGMVQWRAASFRFGTLEFRARFAGGTGTWPAVWMLGANCQVTNITTADGGGACAWPTPGSQEIDVAEIYGGGAHTGVNQGLITSAGSANCSATTTDVTANWHVYTLVWTAAALTWKIDGRTTCTLRQNVPTTPMFVMINTAVGGSGGGTIVDSTLPQQTIVDYLKVTPP